jgi:hypothetical protein
VPVYLCQLRQQLREQLFVQLADALTEGASEEEQREVCALAADWFSMWFQRQASLQDEELEEGGEGWPGGWLCRVMAVWDGSFIVEPDMDPCCCGRTGIQHQAPAFSVLRCSMSTHVTADRPCSMSHP